MPNVLGAGQILSILVSAWLLVGDPRNASKIGEQADAEDYHADDVKVPSPRVPPRCDRCMYCMYEIIIYVLICTVPIRKQACLSMSGNSI